MIGLQDRGPPRAPSSTRARAAHALDYYNTHVHRAWSNGGLRPSPDPLHRSNSSLELAQHDSSNGGGGGGSGPAPHHHHAHLRREYGSHGSIDAPPTTGDAFFAMLQDYRPAVLADQRSPGPAEYLRGRGDVPEEEPQSPRTRVKLGRLWGEKRREECFGEAEEIARRRAFVHYDCQSMVTNLNFSARMRRMLAKRRNTTTGASAATILSKSTTEEATSLNEEDGGDGRSNDLVQSCPFFRNEIGGEEERVVSLTRVQPQHHRGRVLHRPPLAYGVAVLEFPPGETHWRHSTCPYQRLPRPIESVDQGALYYRKYFHTQEHQNWFGMDEQLGPVAISLRREKVNQTSSSSLIQYQYRLVIRTSELQTFRGTILEDAIPSIKASSVGKNLPVKEVLEYVAPEIQLATLKLGVQNQQTEEQILKLDEQGLNNHYKVGVMYCRAGQSTEEEMYNNEEAGPAFVEFLETVGKTVRLKGFGKYKAGLDNKSDSTGHYSVYSQYQDCEIMFHVSTMLPFTPNNRQQLLRKRHIGNDIVTIVFQEPGALPFTPKGIRSQFQHVFIVVQAINPCTENTHYKVSVSRSKEVEVFGPPIKDGAIFPKGKAFAEFLLAKVVNAENAAHRSDKFVTMATRTRQEYLKELVLNHSTSTPVDTHQKFSIFSSKKKDKIRPRFIPDACQRGAILWQVLLDDSGQSQHIECFLGISTDSLVLIEETSKQIVFVTPCKSILGWSNQGNSLRIYHHQGECMTMQMRDIHGDRDELVEIIDRLKAVTQGMLANELKLRRNIMGQLGFHVQPDGIVTLVESAGEAWAGGLRQNSRLVEICKVAVSTLTYDQMVDLLKTSIVVTLTVIPPLLDGSPRKGCTLQNCKYNEANYECDYDSPPVSDDATKSRKAPQMQQAGNHRRIYERSFSPPRSSNSSGYGTGSSSKSFHGPEGAAGNSNVVVNEDKWYDTVLQELEPPPVPQKTRGGSNTFPAKRAHGNCCPGGQQTVHHGKIQVSHSLPLQHITYNQPMTATLHDYVTPRSDGHSTDSGSAYAPGGGSEDELSNGSLSPRSRRRHQHLGNGSRTHSPRSLNGEAAAKLRPGVTPRSSNRNSANLSSSNFQEELLRLINPDSIEEGEGLKGEGREVLSKQPPEVILTMARPATVISNASTTSSPLPSEFHKSGHGNKDDVTETSTPTKSKSVVSLEEFPVPEDWPTLVDTATKVLMQVASDGSVGKREEERWGEEGGGLDVSITSSVSSSTSVPELQGHVGELESSLKRETRRRLSLENEVRRLKEENKKLKDQAQSAVLQLRKFTEWFFKNVQRQ